jgi:DNA-binding MarR family transcriptional regulator
MDDRRSEPADGGELGYRLSTAVVLFHEAIGHRLGLSAADHKALGIVASKGPLTAGALAQLTGLSPGAVTGLVDRLESGGHVRRTPDPTDRRRTLITAVDRPRSDLGGIFAALTADMNKLASRYDEKESAAINDFLRRTIDILTAHTRRLGTAASDPAPADRP